jgi:hypothetical protein
MTKPPQPSLAASAPLGRVMWAQPRSSHGWVVRNHKESLWAGPIIPVLVLPLDPASVQGMREQIAEALAKRINPREISHSPDHLPPSDFYPDAECVLAALNITSPRRTKGKKGGRK